MNVKITDTKYIITVKIISSYINYIVGKATCKFKRCNNSSKIEKENILVFEKFRNAKRKEVVRYCSNCGNPMDVNKFGYCEFCYSTYKQENYNYVLTSITTY